MPVPGPQPLRCRGTFRRRRPLGSLSEALRLEAGLREVRSPFEVLAVNRVWRNEAGETKEEVTFVDVDVFGRTAERRTGRSS